jgi:hypothetical protein
MGEDFGSLGCSLRVFLGALKTAFGILQALLDGGDGCAGGGGDGLSVADGGLKRGKAGFVDALEAEWGVVWLVVQGRGSEDGRGLGGDWDFDADFDGNFGRNFDNDWIRNGNGHCGDGGTGAFGESLLELTRKEGGAEGLVGGIRGDNCYWRRVARGRNFRGNAEGLEAAAEVVNAEIDHTGRVCEFEAELIVCLGKGCGNRVQFGPVMFGHGETKRHEASADLGAQNAASWSGALCARVAPFAR